MRRGGLRRPWSAACLATLALLAQLLLGLAPAVGSAPHRVPGPAGEPGFALAICTAEGLKSWTPAGETPGGTGRSPETPRPEGQATHCPLCLPFVPVGLPPPPTIDLPGPRPWAMASAAAPAPTAPRGRDAGGPPGARGPPPQG